MTTNSSVTLFQDHHILNADLKGLLLEIGIDVDNDALNRINLPTDEELAKELGVSAHPNGRNHQNSGYSKKVMDAVDAILKMQVDNNIKAEKIRELTATLRYAIGHNLIDLSVAAKDISIKNSNFFEPPPSYSGPTLAGLLAKPPAEIAQLRFEVARLATQDIGNGSGKKTLGRVDEFDQA